MDTSQYLSMFLEESRENLRTLNDSLLELEKKVDDLDKISEIFRVTHTIKGMAATMGFSDMSELTHKMEDVLAKFRDGELKITQDVVSVLFKCLDILERMVDNIESGEEEVFEINKMIKLLEKSTIISDENKRIKSDMQNKQYNLNFEFNEYDINIIRQAKESGFNVLQIKIELMQTTLLKSARVFLIFQELEVVGEIIKSNPSSQDIESEKFDFSISMILITTSKAEVVNEIISRISEIEKFKVTYIEDGFSSNMNEHSIVKKELKDNDCDIKEVVCDIDAKGEVEKNIKKSSEKKGKNTKSVHQSVRVDLEKLDKLMNMVSELVINRTRLEQIASEEKNLELTETLEQVARTTSDLQDLVMKIRMLPLNVVFSRFPRMIRDVSVELSKDVDFVIEGKDTELDRTVIDEIGEPLIHLLRNAIDHGIETKEKRIENGKSAKGTIKLVAYQEGTKAVIKVQDDGAGISVKKVKAKAEKIGINIEGFNDEEIRALIFSSGFSTNEKVTGISGRGVGMDVVKTKISLLGGTLDLISEENVGSTFIIKLPLTLQIIQALLVKVGDENFAISLGYIDRVIDFNSIKIKKSNSKEVIIYSNRVIPLLRLDKYFSIDSNLDNSKKFIIIAKVADKEIGLLVDKLLGEQEIVIKPLGKSLSNIKEYIGATILGNGIVTLILDVAALV